VLNDLMVFIKPYRTQGRLEVWADPYIRIGDRWKRNIDRALERAKVGVLLISQNFAASDFIHELELPALLAAAERSELVLLCIPITTIDPSVLGLQATQYQWARPAEQPLDRAA
jgi:internalin A